MLYSEDNDNWKRGEMIGTLSAKTNRITFGKK